MGYEVNDIVRVALDEGFKTVEPIEYPQTVYRAVSGNRQDGSITYINQLLNAKNGDIIIDKGYSYTSAREDQICSCNGVNDEDVPNIKLIINLPEGARVSHHPFSAQSEVLLPRNAEFRVVNEAKVVTDEDGFKTTEIELEYVLPEDKN